MSWVGAGKDGEGWGWGGAGRIGGEMKRARMRLGKAEQEGVGWRARRDRVDYSYDRLFDGQIAAKA